MHAFAILLIASIALPVERSALAATAGTAPRSDSPWTPFVGCWKSAAETEAETSAVPLGDDAPRAMTCILPVPGDPLSAEFVELANGTETGRSRIRADGTFEGFAAQQCVGRESARFSVDGARVFVRGELICGEGPSERIAAIFSITAAGDLLHVRGRDDDADPRVVFRSLSAVAHDRVPLAVREALSSNDPASEASRQSIAIRTLDADVLAETARSAPAAVVEIWLAATIMAGAEPPVMSEELRNALQGAAVPPRVVALLEAFADPARHAVAYSSAGAETIRLEEVDGGRFMRSATAGTFGATNAADGRAWRCNDLIYGAGGRNFQISAASAQLIESTCPGALSLATMLRAARAYEGSLDRHAPTPVPGATAPVMEPMPAPTTVGAPPKNRPDGTPREPGTRELPPSAPAPSQRQPPPSAPAPAPSQRQPPRSAPAPATRQPAPSAPAPQAPAPSAPVRRPHVGEVRGA